MFTSGGASLRPASRFVAGTGPGGGVMRSTSGGLFSVRCPR